MSLERVANNIARKWSHSSLVLRLSLTVHRSRLDSELAEAEARTIEEAERFVAERDRVVRESKQPLAVARVESELSTTNTRRARALGDDIAE